MNTVIVPTLPAILIAAIMCGLIALAFVRLGRTRGHIRKSLEDEGYRVYRMESRLFTRGPFPEMRRVPGMKYGDVLYRVVALDASGASHVLWARVPSGAPWTTPRWEVRPDTAANTSQGLNAAVFRVTVLLIVAALFLLTTFGIGQAATPRGAADLWARSRDVYAALTSYSDSGTVEIEYGSAVSPLRERHTFRTYFRRPRSYFFEFVKAQNVDQVVVWSDADAFHGWWRTTGVESTYPKGTGATAFTTATPLTKGSIALIAPLVFTGSGLAGTLTEVGDLEDAGAEPLGGRPCRKLVGVARSVYRMTGHETNVRRTAIWIDTETYLVRKIVEDTPKGSIAGQVNRVTTTFSPHANPSLDDRRFTFTAPEAR